MSLVLDSSVTLAWIYSDETTGEIRRIFDRILVQGAWVPTLWRLEVANVLEMGCRRGRYDANFRDAALADLALLSIREDGDTGKHAWGAALRLASHHKLTLYDAVYLELAHRRSLPLATLDNELRNAALAENIEVL